jgi:hypothetical protein
MDAFCQQQFNTYAAEGQVKLKQQKLKGQNRALRALLVDAMRSQNMKNVQVAGPDGQRLQVKLGRYYLPVALTAEALAGAPIDWNAAAQQSIDDQCAHLVAEVRKLTQDGRPCVNVTPCGKRSRTALPLVGGDDRAADPFRNAAIQLATHKEIYRGLSQQLKVLTGGAGAAEAAAEALQGMRDTHRKKRAYKIRHNGVVHNCELVRKDERKRPSVTLKLLKGVVRQILEAQHARHTFNPTEIRRQLLSMVEEATQPVLKSKVEFRMVKAKDHHNEEAHHNKRARH